MNVTIPRSSLLAITEPCARGAGNGSPPITSCIRLSVAGDIITGAATDLEVWVRQATTAPAPGTDGVVCVNAKKLHDVARAAADGPVTLACDGSMLSIRAGRARTNLPTVHRDDFPDVPAVEPTATAALPGSQLAEALALVRFCASSDDTRRQFCAAQVRLVDGHIALDATDGHRATQVRIPAEISGSLPEAALVPTSGIDRILPLLTEDLVTLEFAPGFLHVLSDGGNIIARLIDGDAPDISAVMPTGYTISAKVGSADLVAAIRRVSVVASERARGIRLKRGPTIKLSSASPEHGEASDTVTIFGEPHPGTTTVGMNGSYISDIARALDSRVATLWFGTEEASPILVTCDDIPSLRHVIMPMRI